MRRLLVVFGFLLTGFQVSACAGSLAIPEARAPRSEVAVVEEAPGARARVPQSPQSTVSSPGPAVAHTPSLKLHLTYSERLLVPRGSEIIVAVRDANGVGLSNTKTTTKRDAPPYVVDVPLKSTPAYPLKVEAGLVSRVGHRFSESTEVSEAAAHSTAGVEIRLQKE